MTDHSNDETRLRATETQMRRALGLQSTRARPGDGAPPPGPTGARRPARRFVRDGEVAVSVVARDAAAGTNRLDAAWQALEAQTAAREQAERQLVAAQETIRELQTQLAHARLARNEAVQRAAEEKQASEQVLAAVRAPAAAAGRAGRRPIGGARGVGAVPDDGRPAGGHRGGQCRRDARAGTAAGPAEQGGAGPTGAGTGLRGVVEAGLAGAAALTAA